jgi:hypothetical protein
MSMNAAAGRLLGAALLLAGCSGGPSSTGTGATTCADAPCDGACVVGVCVPRRPLPATWDLEIAPLGDDSAALTELEGTDLAAAAPGALVLALAAPTAATVMVTFPTTVPAPQSYAVELAVRPLIPGRRDLLFDGLSLPRAPPSTALTLPGATRGRPATVSLSPLSPDDMTSPPRNAALTVAPNMAVDLTMAPALATVTGRLVDAAGMVLPTQFVARAFLDGAAVSNRGFVDLDTGAFVLLLPQAAIDKGAIVEIGPELVSVPQLAPSVDPTFVSASIANLDLGTIELPPFTPPVASNPFVVTVIGGAGSAAAPVAGALVRATTTFTQTDPAQASRGSARFSRDGLTDTDGAVSLALLPGTAMTGRTYEFAVIPPADSPYGTACFTQVLTSGGFIQPDKVLPVRPVLSGTVRDAMGAPVANVTVAATPGSDLVAGCSATTTSAGYTVTGSDGTFQLPLDAGTYQLDYDPPAGAPVPRLTELAMTIAADAQHDVALPPAAVIEGNVVSIAGPSPGATVRVFEPRCGSSEDCFGPARTPPWLRGQGASDASGHFQVVVPADTMAAN